MGRRFVPSRQNMLKAMQLGGEMARRDPHVQPWLESAHRYATYGAFAKAHRQKLEHAPAFARWDALLAAIVEKEAATHSVENPQHWDRFYADVAGAVYGIFWSAWERVSHLEQQYVERIEAAERDARQDPIVNLKLLAQAKAKGRPKGERDIWSRLAGKVFGENEPEADFWELPEPGSLGAKPPDE